MVEINYTLGMSTQDPPEIKKQGVVSVRHEMTPVVFKGRLCRVETYWADGAHYAVLHDVQKQEDISMIVHKKGLNFFSAYCENDVLYAFATYVPESREAGGTCTMFRSEDGINWEEIVLFRRPGWRLFNTSVCKGADGYYMAIEVCSSIIPGDPLETPEIDPVIGHPFTEFFLKSDDLIHWEWLPDDHCLSTERYTACPAMRYCDGYYYVIALVFLPHRRLAPYIYRTKDFFAWEIGLHNPVLMYSKEDRIIKPGAKVVEAYLARCRAGEKRDATEEELAKMGEELVARIRTHNNINNCDVDLCEFEGKTYIYYLTGDQGGYGVMCEAQYDGPMDEFLQSFFK